MQEHRPGHLQWFISADGYYCLRGHGAFFTARL